LAAGSGGGFLGVLAVAALWAGWHGPLAQTGTRAEVPPASADVSGATVHALARLEPADGLIVVGVRPGTRVDKVLVSQGEAVKAGQPLGVLEGQETAQAQLAVALARKADATRRRARERSRFALDRQREDQTLKAHSAMLDNIAKAVKSQTDLVEEQISRFPKEALPDLTRALNELKLKRDQLHIEQDKALFEREQARIDQQLLARKRAQEDEALADGGTDDQLLDREIDLARTALAATTVYAPSAGTVLDVMAHPGETSSGPLLALGDLTTVAAVAEVDQSDVLSVREGDAATATVLGTVVPGKVTRVSRLVGRNQLANVDPRALQDLRVVKVNIRLDRAEPAVRLINLQVEVVITPRGSER
jgi:HlyD family secretion protein